MENDPYIQGIRNGDRKIVAEIWKDIFPAVRKWVREGGGNEDDAKDIFQDAMMLVYDKAAQPDFQLSSKFSTFFLGISRNLLGNLFQKKYFRHITISDDDKYMGEPLDFEEIERRNLFDKAKALQGADCMKLMELYFQKKTMAEIAVIMSFKSEQYAKLRKFQCKERLEALVKQQPGFKELFNKKKP